MVFSYIHNINVNNNLNVIKRLSTPYIPLSVSLLSIICLSSLSVFLALYFSLSISLYVSLSLSAFLCLYYPLNSPLRALNKLYSTLYGHVAGPSGVRDASA